MPVFTTLLDMTWRALQASHEALIQAFARSCASSCSAAATLLTTTPLTVRWTTLAVLPHCALLMALRLRRFHLTVNGVLSCRTAFCRQNKELLPTRL